MQLKNDLIQSMYYIMTHSTHFLINVEMSVKHGHESTAQWVTENWSHAGRTRKPLNTVILPAYKIKQVEENVLFKKEGNVLFKKVKKEMFYLTMPRQISFKFNDAPKDIFINSYVNDCNISMRPNPMAHLWGSIS